MAKSTINMPNPEEILEVYAEKVRKRTTKTVNEMAKLLKKEIVKNTSHEDGHDRNWMRRNKHPYSTRDPRPPHKKPIVHKQGDAVSYDLSGNVEIFHGVRKDERLVGIDPDKVPYVGDILYGTETMIGRNFLAYSLLQMNKKFKKMIKKIGKVK